MKGSKEERLYVNRQRSRVGKKNGVVSWLFDHPEFERKDANNKNNYRRNNKRFKFKYSG
jgi:hypothetical protein